MSKLCLRSWIWRTDGSFGGYYGTFHLQDLNTDLVSDLILMAQVIGATWQLRNTVILIYCQVNQGLWRENEPNHNSDWSTHGVVKPLNSPLSFYGILSARTGKWRFIHRSPLYFNCCPLSWPSALTKLLNSRTLHEECSVMPTRCWTGT